MGRIYNNEKYRISIIISMLIVMGFAAVVAVNYLTYSKVIKDDILNISKLSSSNIYSEINNELIKPIFVSLTMANDRFLIQWLEEEKSRDVELLQDYLSGIELKYDYSSVFMVSNQTKKYYHFNGVHKSISEENDHDQWYFEFLESKKLYDLDVDIDEVTNEMTVFINCRIVDEANEVLGVVGVGLSMNQVQKLLGTFETAYGLEAFIMDEQGLIQVHTDDALIENYRVYQDPIIQNIMPKITANTSSLETFRYSENGLDGYIITRYIEDLEWFLVVKKDTSVLQKSFDDQIAEEFIILALVIFGVVITSNRLIKRHEVKLIAAAKTDQLTGLLNRRGFDHTMFDRIKEAAHKEQVLCVFIFDIDNFKSINDTYGHLFGDKVIEQVAMFVKKAIGNENILARWGGDEFAGYIKGDYIEAKRLLEELHHSFSINKNFVSHQITISMGITISRTIDTPDTIMARADKALYQAKLEGKNKVCESV